MFDDISKFLFGDKSPVVTPTSTSTTVTQGTPEEQAARRNLMSMFGPVYQQTAAATNAFAGTPGIAAPSNATLLAEQMAMGAVPGMQGMTPSLTNAWGTALAAPDVNNNPYLQKAIQAAINPVTEQFTTQVMPTIGRSAVDAGQYGGSRQGIAEGLASGKYLQSVGDISSKMSSDAYTTGLQTMLQGMNLTPTVQNAMLQPAAVTAGVGQAQDTRAQAQLDDAAARQLWKINAPWQPLTNYANLVYGGGTTSATTNAQGQMVTPSTDKGLFGAIAPIASMAASFAGMPKIG